jgi:penicillin-binding protein 2B
MRANAIKLVPILRDHIDTTGLSERDKIDYYLADAANLSKIEAEIPRSETYNKNGSELSASQIYALEVSKVPQSAIDTMTDDEQMAAELYKQMNATQLYNTSDIASGGISPDQQAQIGAEESQLPGISFGNAWQYNIAQNLLTPLIGTVSTQKAGLPADQVSSYLAKGYSLNDRVGTSYLQQGYEAQLQGKHSIQQLVISAKGNITKKQTVPSAQTGPNLKLSVDLNFENGVQQILQNDFNQYVLNDGFGGYSTGIYAVVLDTKTGAILAMNGMDYDTQTGKQTADTLAPMVDAFQPGSTVKPATLTAGWASNAISGNQSLDDQEIQLAGTAPISSWFTSGLIPTDTINALTLSSNTYMIQVALRMMGTPYYAGMTLSDTNRTKTFDTLRQTYASYGLGTSTGVDIPGSSNGLIPSTSLPTTTTMDALFESFGQFDTYTPLQMAQYAMTLANNGTRIAPHLVHGLYESGSSLGNQLQAVGPKTLGSVNISADNMDLLHQGMNGCVNGSWLGNVGTGYYMRGSATTIYAKDGQAQQYVGDVQTTDDNVVAFAPGPNPQIAIAVMTPMTIVKDGGVADEVSEYATRDIVNLYSSMYGFK